MYWLYFFFTLLYSASGKKCIFKKKEKNKNEEEKRQFVDHLACVLHVTYFVLHILGDKKRILIFSLSGNHNNKKKEERERSTHRSMSLSIKDSTQTFIITIPIVHYFIKYAIHHTSHNIPIYSTG